MQRIWRHPKNGRVVYGVVTGSDPVAHSVHLGDERLRDDTVVGFRSKIAVLINWAWAYIGHGARCPKLRTRSKQARAYGRRRSSSLRRATLAHSR